MSFMRKLVGGGRSSAAESGQHHQDNTLGLMHLKKLFTEFRQTQNCTQTELEEKLYCMLPLFCKVFGSAPTNDMTEKFGDILQFCSHVSRLMVGEIRRRASNQSTEAASCEIVKFLEIETTEDSSNGWMLLSTINLLSTGHSSLIDCMTAASLPSTLVKCLYLFFDLPDVKNGHKLDPGCEFSPLERRILLQKIFVQVLVRLCSHSSPAEELARKDDLTLLFSAITSWCPAHNVPWRKSAAEVLMTLSRHGLTPNVVQYIHNKGCVALCTENMQRVQELSPIELVEMFVTVFCFLKDSSEVSQILLDDFRSCQGYIFLSEFLLRMEQDEKEEAVQALRNLVLLVGSLTTCGFIELKAGSTSSGSLFQMPGFTVPQPSGKGVSVRNLQAFQVLQTVFIKSQSVHLCSTILDVISSIYHQDNANYFILESQCTLSQFAEKIHTKNEEIQNKFFEIVEFVVFNLNYVPCKELISLSILIKTNHSTECSMLCVKTLLRILRHHNVYKDVFREVGLLEVMVTCLQRYAALLKEPTAETKEQGHMEISDKEQEMGFLVMDALTLLLNSNSQNAGVFRECGGARCAHNMVPYPQCRFQALTIVQQLVVSNGGDDDMGTLLGLMHTASTTALELKTHVLKSLLNVLRESHRTRTVFRKVGGFVYVMSVLVSMEGCLADPPRAPWDTVSRRDVILLLKTVFSTLTVAMRFEPANAKFFATEVRYSSLTEAVRLLGCFSPETEVQRVPTHLKAREETEFSDLFCKLREQSLTSDLPRCLISATMMLRYLYDMALDNFDRSGVHSGNSSPNLKRMSSVLEQSMSAHDLAQPLTQQKRASTGSLTLTLAPMQPEPVVVHAGAVISMLHLVPGIICDSEQLTLDLQYYVCEVLKSLMRSERNQQVMCESGLPHELLSRSNMALADETHVLHPPMQYMFERLSAQYLTPKDLRDFLRLGDPLCCAVEQELEPEKDVTCPTFAIDKPHLPEKRANPDSTRRLKNGGPVPLTRVKCLVSMTTPRDVRLHGASITPAFVEFDMSAEGFGCLYLPSIAPQGPPTPSVVGAGMIGGTDQSIVGGIGTGERMFPPQAGMTFSTWVCVDKYSSPVADPHPVRLLTIVRSVANRDENLICLAVYLAPRDRALFVTTLETHMPQAGEQLEMEPLLNDTNVRFWCPELTQEGQWRHVTLVFNRAGIMKNSSVSLYVDKQHVSTQKLHYLSPNLGGGGATPAAAATSVFAYVGSPPPLRRVSRLVWRQGPAHLFEDVMSPAMIQFLYHLGPNYVGSFQAPIISNKKDAANPLIAEDKIVFGIHAHAMSLMTIAKIRKVYNKTDAKSIAKQLGMSAHENATPIRILHNSCGHLSGPARSFGSILMGYLGVRTFCPRPVAKMVLNVGGISALLGLIAMAADVEGLYAAVKALVCVVRSNKNAQREMTRTDGYKMLAVLYRKKRDLLNSHILHLTFSLVGTVDSGRESTVIPNKAAFEDLLCDLEVWHEAPGDLQRSLYEHFYELLTESSEQKNNMRLMQDLGLVPKLLHILKDETLSHHTVQTLASVISVLLAGGYFAPSLLRFGQFMVSTLPNFNQSEKGVALGFTNTLVEISKPSFDEDSQDGCEPVTPHKITLRNSLLEMLLRLLTTNPTAGSINVHACDEMQRVLGFDWLLLFMQGNLHPTTVVLTMRILCQVLSHPGTLQKFREGVSGGGWLRDTECVLQNRVGTFLGFRLSASGKDKKQEINRDICHVPGFQALQLVLPRHADTPDLYFLLVAMLLGQQVKPLPERIQFDLDSMWTYIYGVPADQSVPANNAKRELSVEAACVILSMVRAMLNQVGTEEEQNASWTHEFPVTLMQFLLYLYHNQPDFAALCASADFLCALAATLFPYRSLSESESELSSPLEDFKPFPESDSMVLVDATERNPSKSVLTTHPARKFVVDFLRMIVIDSLSQPQTKMAPIIDHLFDASPEHASRAQQKEFQTELLSTLMEHLLAADALLGDQGALPAAAAGATSYTHTANNIFYFAQRVVDKLWQGVYTKESKEVFDFISKLISQAKMKASGVSLDTVYRCLNRTILYQLSRRMETVADQMAVLDALHKLTNNRSLVFGPGNYDQEFIGCLCHCLVHLIEDPSYISDPAAWRKTTWHCDPDAGDEPRAGSPAHTPAHAQRDNSASMTHRDGLQLVANAARRVWEELYIHKKPTIEEVFKVALGTGDTGMTPDLITVKPQIQEAAARVWVAYYENERKCTYTTNTEKLQNQLQSKLQKVGHGVTGVLRFASRASRVKKDVAVKPSTASIHDMTAWTLTHISIVKDLVEFQYRQYVQTQKHMEKYLLDKWTETEKELMRERGLWGPPVGSELDKWMLDMTEGPCRMRKKMIKNDMFYVHYPFRPEVGGDNTKPPKHKAARSYDSKDYFERYRSQSLVGEDSLPMPQEDLISHLREIAEEGPEPETFTEMPMNIPCLLPRASRQNSVRSAPGGGDDEDADLDSSVSQDGSEDAVDAADSTSNADNTDYQKVLRLLEEGDKLTHMYRCARCQGLDTMEGLLLFGKDHFYVVDGFTLLKSREIVDIDSLPPNLHDPIIPKASKTSSHNQKNMCSKFAYEDIREVHKRRYLLQPIAIEVFSADGRNYLLAFPRKIRNKVHTRFLQCATSMLDSAQESVSGQRLNAKVEPGAGLISSLIGEKSVTQRWERGEISNFEYLMCLNTLAGRSYNDLMQYPVFPWIVSDYDAEELDLTNPATFRDLSAPMGAQTPDRLNNFQKRYSDWDDPQGETPPYHYGTHYSSAMIVASYLLRLEPFTQHFLRLQGGHFDLADRMFHSIKECWLSASKHNMADVRELIPEFFYLPEFLVNSNNFDLGAKQSGVALHHVVLPNWAKGDPREFIRAHREALESDFVSAHLHEWIDLIFGYKQSGQGAVDAVNVFHHLFYEGNVDIFSIDDPLKKNATIGFINNFGQIPKQLFKKPHPQKKLNARSLDILPMVPLVNTSADKLFFNNLDNLKPTMQPIKELKGPVGNIVHYERTVLSVEQNKVLIPPTYNRYLSWGFSDLSVRVGNYDSDKACAIYENLDNGDILCAACPNARMVVTAGTSTVVNVWEFATRSRDKRALTLKQPLCGHTEPVICLAASSAYNVIVSGSRDRTCILWDLSRLVFVRQLRGHAAPVAAVCINELTGDIATCAGTYLHVWSVNGDELASINTATSRNQQILCVAMSQMMEWSQNNVIMTGNSDGVVRMWSLEFVQVLDESKLKEKETNSTMESSNAVSAPKAIPVLTRASSSGVDPSPTEDSLAAERLQEFKDPGTHLAAKEVELGSSAESEGGSTVEHLKQHLDRVSLLQQQSADQASVGSNEDLAEFGRDIGGGDVDSAVDVAAALDDVNQNATVSQQQQQQQQSKDQTSPTSDFVFVTDNEVKDAVKSAQDSMQRFSPRRIRGLREGFRWQKQLVFRSKLTMHTAFERKDNKDPAAITAIAVSKDHRIVYVGDAKGRIFSWTVTDQPGRVVADHWIKDEGMDCCVACAVKFSFSERRHHCRNCGQLFCSKCSRFEAEIKRLRITKPVRVCQACHTALRVQQADEQTRARETHAPKV